MTEPTAAELNESAMNHFSRGNGVEAARQLQWALIANPEYAEAWHNRAMVLRALNDPFDAILCCDRAIQLDPYVAAYHNTQGVCWAQLNQMGNACLAYDEALLHDPNLAAAWHNKGYAAKLSDNISIALDCYTRAVELSPTADFKLSLASILLRAGRLGEGWELYEERFNVGDAFHRHMPMPHWNGSDPLGAIIFYGEQGYGDVIQFIRFVPMFKKKYPNVKVYAEVKKPLVDLVMTMEGFDGVIQYGDPLPAATHCLPIMSIPRVLHLNSYADFHWEAPYFNVPRVDIHWQSLGAREDTLKVGLCWASGNRPYQPELREYAERKSIAPQFLKPFGELANVTWVSLQVPKSSEEPPFDMVDVTHDLHDFAETAKLIFNLDIVVSVDTSVAHLSGAMGKPTYLLTPFDNCWRWMGANASSPWYPSVRQFRQPTPGDWPGAIHPTCLAIEKAVLNIFRPRVLK